MQSDIAREIKLMVMSASTNIMLLDRNNREVGIYPPRLAELLEQRSRSEAGMEELDRLHRERGRLLCRCGRVLHVVQNKFPFLRRNPGQTVRGPECELCKSSHEYGIQIKETGEARRQSGIDFVMATRTHVTERPGDAADRKRSGKRKNTLKYARGFATLFTLIDRAGFTSLSSSLPWTEMWQRFHDQLKAIPLHPKSRRNFAEFCWLPGGFYQHGLPDLNARMLKYWDHPDIQAEGWVFWTMPDMPNPEEVSIYSQSEAMRRSLQQKGREIYKPYKIEVPKHCVAPIGLSGPYLALAVGSARDKGDPKFRKPRFHRLLLQAVVSEHSPIPCESSHERALALRLQKLGIPFLKPVFDNPEGLRPDFILTKNRIIIEVQGMTNDEYRQHKREIHQRMRASQEYNSYQLITFDVNDGEKLDGFEHRLMKII